MSVLTRPLTGYIVGLSISDGDDTEAHGFPTPEVNRTVLRIVASLLGQGAGVSFGHDWRDDGVMESIHSYVERYHPLASEGQAHPMLWNFVPWPSRARLTEPQQQRLKETLKVEQPGLPASLRREADRPNPNASYLRSRGLTHMRHKLTS